MAIFLTGSTGYIGAHIASILLQRHSDRLNVLVRAKTEEEANERLWRSLQLHLDFPEFRDSLETRVSVFRGDLTDARFGLENAEYARLVGTTEAVIHCAASLNRKSEKSCLNVNLRGTLEVAQLARRAQDAHGLRRFSQVSTVAVAGHRSHEIVTEDGSIDWNRSDYDPYARTKKFCEHMVRELLPEVPRTVFRPSIVLGDSRRAETTQFDMVRAFVFLAGLPVLPFRSTDRIDIVPVDYVAESIVALHQKPDPLYEIYHLSSGTASETFGQLTHALAQAAGKMEPLYWPGLEQQFSSTVNWLSHYRGGVGRGASLLKVFMPYLVWDTVFENSRVVAEMGRAPEPFSKYSYPLLRFSRDCQFSYPYQEWPGSSCLAVPQVESAAATAGHSGGPHP
jgi:thioester reductase-like protein